MPHDRRRAAAPDIAVEGGDKITGQGDRHQATTVVEVADLTVDDAQRQAADYASDCELFPDFPGRPRVPKGDRLQPCDCGEPADRPMFAGAICDGCFDELVERVAARQALRGWGRRVEPSTTDPEIRSRFPAAYRDLRCTSASCSATWYGPPGEPCSWCAEALDRMRHDQADLLLTPEMPDVDDARHDGAVKAWAARLARGVETGIVTELEARQVLHSSRCS